MRHLIPTLLLLLAVVAAGCTTEPPASRVAAGASPAVTAGDDVAVDDPSPRRMLRPFDSCDALLAHYVAGAEELVGPYGLGGGGFYADDTAAGGAEELAATDDAAAATAAGGDAARQDVSGTNTQEQGVDEPDLVKTDGDLIVTTVTGRVQVVDVASQAVVSTVPLPEDAHGAELLLDGDTLLVLATGGAPGPVGRPVDDALVPAYAPTRTTLTTVDLSDPAAPVVLGGVRMEGAYRSARMVDGTVRVVMVSEPTGLAFTQPTDGSLQAEEAAEAENRRILAESDVEDWIPHLQTIAPDGTDGPVRPLLECTDIAQPPTFAGLSTVSVLTLDLRGGAVEPSSATGLVAAGDTVYASTERLVVATSPWGGWITPFLDVVGQPDAEELRTDLHAFDITDPTTTRYVASGSVEGTLIGQFALDEQGGVIRVATTTQPDWSRAPTGEESQSSLITLAAEGEQLVELGRVDGLGVTEQIYAVRYLGPDLAAIITFRQTDPLYLIDTSDPAAPTVTGELEIPGFSSYLHPVADGWLLGVGQDADPETGQTQGLQASLFDVRDLANPQQVARVSVGQGHSPVEHDHRAFLHWTPTGQAVVPAELYPAPEDIPATPAPGTDPYGPTFIGALVLDVGEGVLAEAGRVAHADPAPGTYPPAVIRSMVIGDGLWTLSHEGVARHDLAGLTRTAVIPLR